MPITRVLLAGLALADDHPTSPGTARVLGSTRASVAVSAGYARFKTAGGAEVAFGPDIDFMPTILAPYIAFNLGLIGAPPAPDAP